LSYAMNLCSRQEKCRSEISEKLASFNILHGDIEKIIEVLIKEDFINESRYAGNFASDKLRFNKWGKIKIGHMLKRKNIPEILIEEAMEGIEENYYLEILKEELLKKRKTIKGNNAFELRGKLFRFAQQRGFETGLIYGILDEVL
ncbi:regulatory protein RecX, partial [Bacteroidota bacterium]